MALFSISLPERFYKVMTSLTNAIDRNSDSIEDLTEELRVEPPSFSITGISHVPRPVPLKGK